MRGQLYELWISDGIYGSLSCIKNNSADLMVMPLACYSDSDNIMCAAKVRYQSTVFGPTCDAMDTILKGELLPELEVGLPCVTKHGCL